MIIDPKKIIKLSQLSKNGIAAVAKYLFEVEDRVDTVQSDVLDMGKKLVDVEKELKERVTSDTSIMEKVTKNIFKDIKGDTGEKGEKGDKGESGTNGIDGKNGLNGKDGKDGKDGKSIVGPAGKNGTDGTDGSNGKDGSPDTGEIIVNKINDISEDGPKIKTEHIEGYEKTIEDIKSSGKNIRLVGGARGIQLYVDGSKKGTANYLNLVGGTNVTLTYSYAFGRNDIIISATGSSGGSFTVLPKLSGTVDDTNLAFTFSDEPQLVVINGASYAKTGGAITWTYLTGTVTLSSPVGSGGNIYGIK